MKKYITLLSGLFIFLAMSCEETVIIDTEASAPQLVVEGRIELIKGANNSTQRLRLSQLGEFFATTEPAPALNATVWVEDTEGNPYDYIERGNGLYECVSLSPVANATYTLHILWEGEEYRATETMSSVADIEEIYQVVKEETLFEDGGIKVSIDFNDPAAEQNFYFWEMFINGESALIADPGNNQNVIANDDLFNGSSIVGYLPNEEAVLTAGQEVTIRQLGISKGEYDFYFLLFDQTGRTGQLLDTPAAPIRGNIRNVTNPEMYALGYFGVNEVSQRTLIITE